MTAYQKNLLRRFFSLRNLIPFIIIIAAFVGTFVQNPLGIQREQILLALLAFLAIDSLLERIEMLSNIERDIKHVRDLAEAQFSGQKMLRHRADFPRIEHLITEVRQEFCATGITLDIMATLTGLFEQKAKQGVKIKFIAILPEAEVIEEVARYFGFEQEEIATRIRTNLYKIYHLTQKFPNLVELRVTEHRLANGYFIVDPKMEQGYMTVTPYFFQTPDGHLSPVLFLSKKADDHWFKIYLSDFDNLWNNASQWSPGKKESASDEQLPSHQSFKKQGAP